MNRKGTFRAEASPESGTGCRASVEKGGCRLAWRMEGEEAVRAEEYPDDGKLVYEGILGNTDLVMTVRGEQVKENIVLKERGGQNSFTWLYRIP